MTLNIARVRKYLKDFDFEPLFIEELGWDRHSTDLELTIGGEKYSLRSFAEKRGVQVFECRAESAAKMPDFKTQRKIETQLRRSAREHLVIYTDATKTKQVWKPVDWRGHEFYPHHQQGDSLIAKLQAIRIPLDEEEGLDLLGAVHKLRDAFGLRERVTKRFYDRFQKEHEAFLAFIEGIREQGDREWYASLMLNRLMFVYFIQKKGFLDKDTNYLRNRLKTVQARKGKGKFHTFYRYFLLTLFHQGFSTQPEQRQLDPDLKGFLGDVPYVNGGLFDVHELEEHNPKIDIPDEAFERVFAFFDQYEWTLDTRPLRNDSEINPDVLGYIFEKYINHITQKQMGAYYTKEDITDYIGRNTVIPHLFDEARKKCAVAFQPGSALWRLLQETPERYIYPAVRKGVIDENGEIVQVPAEIEKGIKDVAERGGWNRPAEPQYALPTETWREYAARRQRCLDVRERLLRGEISQIDDFITYNLDIRRFAEDAILSSEGPELLRAFYQAITGITVLDPTCGSGAFLFAALGILEPLYEACLDRMQTFLQELERLGNRASPEKFKDFRAVLDEVARHPNAAYFILKSIIVRNLYGVDIMAEAVEICKLRLFLKLVSQVDTVRQLEPLPDIDFNIRPGNTLVGLATLDDVKRTVEKRQHSKTETIAALPGFEERSEVARIVEDAEIVDRAFQKFHEMQTVQRMNACQFTAQKQELRKRLKGLADQLDHYLAGEYRIDSDKATELGQWRASHQPLHWCAEFFGIIKGGGFNVIIGNPPYVEYKDVKATYTVRDYTTLPCGDLYAYVMERSYRLLAKSGRLGLIVPISVFGVDAFSTLQRLILANSHPLWVSSYANRPSQVFEGAQKRLTIVVAQRQPMKSATVFTTRYHRWRREERNSLMSARIEYSLRPQRFLVFGASLEKLGTDTEACAFAKLTTVKHTLADGIAQRGRCQLFYTRKFGYFLAFLDAVPRMTEITTGKLRMPSELKTLEFTTDDDRYCAIAALSSSTFFWFWNALSDCRNLNRRDILAFPLAPCALKQQSRRKLSALGRKYIGALKETSRYMTKSGLKIETFDYGACKPVIDEIDAVLGDIFGFTDMEHEFVVNYDIKYRIGQDGENEEDE